MMRFHQIKIFNFFKRLDTERLLKDFLPDSAMSSKLPDQGWDLRKILSNLGVRKLTKNSKKYMKYAGQSQNATMKDFGKIIQYKILTIVTSARRNFLLRSLLRDIMSLETSLEMSQHMFILGQGDKNENITIAKQLEQEIKEHGDIIIGNFKDDYEHLSMKTFTERIDESVQVVPEPGRSFSRHVVRRTCNDKIRLSLYVNPEI